jgi:excisionase family DNA binding protein
VSCAGAGIQRAIAHGARSLVGGINRRNPTAGYASSVDTAVISVYCATQRTNGPNPEVNMDRVSTFYTPREVAAALKVSERTVRRWIVAGKLAARRFGRQLRVPAEALEDLGCEPSAEPDAGWPALAIDSFAKDWDNELDAAYDRWREHYAVPTR